MMNMIPSLFAVAGISCMFALAILILAIAYAIVKEACQ